MTPTTNNSSLHHEIAIICSRDVYNMFQSVIAKFPNHIAVYSAVASALDARLDCTATIRSQLQDNHSDNDQ